MYDNAELIVLLGLFGLSFIIVSIFIKVTGISIVQKNKHSKPVTIIFKYSAKLLISIFVYIALLVLFTYPKVIKIENSLKSPVSVKKVLGSKIFLEDGRIIKTDLNHENLQWSIERSDYKIGLVDCGAGLFFEIYVSNPRGLCGNAFGYIPVIPIPRKLKSYTSKLTFGEIEEK